jgi:hypothetical protein
MGEVNRSFGAFLPGIRRFSQSEDHLEENLLLIVSSLIEKISEVLVAF